MLNWLWFVLLAVGVLYGAAAGSLDAVTEAALTASGDAVRLAIEMCGLLCLWLGVLQVAESSGLVDRLGRALSPLVGLLFPDVPKTHPAFSAIVMNFSANLLGLGNAATPMGVEAARRMGGSGEKASNALCLFLVINSSSVQLLPTTVIALRAAEGSAQPAAIALPALAATAISTLVGVAACKLAEARPWG